MNDNDTIATPPRPIPLARLIRSPQNARRTESRAACEELKASILAHGLMQNLVVTDAGDGYYLVVAGARRLAALNELQAEGKLPEDYGVPCRVVGAGEAPELSLAENTIRLAMHPADEYETFAGLIDSGSNAEQVAARFGVTARHVEQRMRLGRVAPELLAAYRAEELPLDALIAFAVTDDRGKQLDVYASLQGWQRRNAHHIRARLTESMADADGKLARFVGLDAYRAAGGTFRVDLFGDGGYLENPELLQALAAEKLRLAGEELKAKGWGWVETSEERDWHFVSEHRRIEPEAADVPPELLAEKARIEQELDAIALAAEEEGDEDALSERQDAAEVRLIEIEETIESFATYDPEAMKSAGCYVAIDADGTLSVEEGLVRRSSDAAYAHSDAPIQRKQKDMPESLRRDLEAWRLQAAQLEIARHPATAFDLLVFHTACRVLDQEPMADGPDVLFRQGRPRPSVEADTMAAEQMEQHRASLPLDWLEEETEAVRFEAFRRLPDDDKHRLLAYCTALTLRPKLSPAAGEGATAYDVALALTGGDMAGYWRPTRTNYLGRVTRDRLLAIGRETLGETWAQAHARDKKGELADRLDRAFAAPDRSERIKRWLPEGMAFALPATPQPSEADIDQAA